MAYIPSNPTGIGSTKQKDLTYRQKQFCENFIKGMQADEAYRKAFDTDNQKTIKPNVSRLFRNPKIKEYIDKIRLPELKKSTYLPSAKNVIREIAKLSFSNIKDFYHADGSHKQMSELTDLQAAAIRQIRTITDTNTGKIYHEIVLYNKLEALEKLVRHLGLYEVDNKQQANKVNLNMLTTNDLEKLLELKDKVTLPARDSSNDAFEDAVEAE